MPAPAAALQSPEPPRRLCRPTGPAVPSLTAAGVLAVAFVAYTWLVVRWEPLRSVDLALDRNYHVQSLWPVLTRVDRIGQRAVCLPVLAVVVVMTVRRHRSWRPAVLAAIAVFSVNLLVLVAKVAMGRGRPVSGRGFFSGGDMYPSGHTANILLVYGLCYHLVAHYGHVSERTRRILLSGVCLLSLTMFTTSLTLRWHWFSDLVGGFLVGGAVLAMTVGIDAALPRRARRTAPGLVPMPPSVSPRRRPAGSRVAGAGRPSRR